MKHKTGLMAISFLFTLTLLAACGNQEEAAQPKDAVTAADVKKDAGQAVETAAKYTMEQKEVYMQKIQARLEELDREIGALGNKIQSGTTELKAEGRAKLEESLNTLRAEKDAAADQYEKLKTSSDKAWDELKAGMDEAMGKLDAAYDKAKAEFE
jgi:predicted aldo/keto reductase-like oxidoreductase